MWLSDLEAQTQKPAPQPREPAPEFEWPPIDWKLVVGIAAAFLIWYFAVTA